MSSPLCKAFSLADLPPSLYASQPPSRLRSNKTEKKNRKVSCSVLGLLSRFGLECRKNRKWRCFRNYEQAILLIFEPDLLRIVEFVKVIEEQKMTTVWVSLALVLLAILFESFGMGFHGISFWTTAGVVQFYQAQTIPQQLQLCAIEVPRCGSSRTSCVQEREQRNNSLCLVSQFLPPYPSGQSHL